MLETIFKQCLTDDVYSNFTDPLTKGNTKIRYPYCILVLPVILIGETNVRANE